jgi:hypothetical protein
MKSKNRSWILSFTLATILVHAFAGFEDANPFDLGWYGCFESRERLNKGVHLTLQYGIPYRGVASTIEITSQ